MRRGDLLTRRGALAAAALTLPGVAFAGKGGGLSRCVGRRPYGGPPPRAALGDAVFDAAARAAASPLTPLVSPELDRRLELAAGKMPIQALTAAIATADGGFWTRTRTADPASTQPTRFFWASVGKAYTATAILQMVEEGRLALDATLDRWAPQAPNARWITIEDLLEHTGGVYSFQNDAGLRATPGYKSPDQLLAVAASHPQVFCPGEAWSYSNTGYVHLGRIIEAVDERPYDQALTRRIVDRLDLVETGIVAPGQIFAGLARPAPAPGTADGTTDDIATPFAAGAVTASAGDVVRFWRGLLSNRLHGAATTRRRFARLYPMAGVGPSFYGLGVMVSDLAAFDPKATDTWLGHAGGLPGAKATVAYSLEKRAFAAVALTGDGSPEATANLLLAGLKA